MREVNDQNFDDIVSNSKKPVMVDFWADWCGPCKTISPVMDQISSEFGDQVVVAKCDVDNNPMVARRYGIKNIPTVIFFKNGEIMDKQIGSAPKSVYVNKLNNL